MLKITELYAFVSMDDTGEGLCAFHDTLGWMPMVCADKARVDSLRAMAQKIADANKKVIVLKRFCAMEVVETIEPKERQP